MQSLKTDQIDNITGGKYIPGAHKDASRLFLRQCIGESQYNRLMMHEDSRNHLYVAARVLLGEPDWNRYVWIEQHGSLDGFPG